MISLSAAVDVYDRFLWETSDRQELEASGHGSVTTTSRVLQIDGTLHTIKNGCTVSTDGANNLTCHDFQERCSCASLYTSSSVFHTLSM
jgi:hypothetical protein